MPFESGFPAAATIAAGTIVFATGMLIRLRGLGTTTYALSVALLIFAAMVAIGTVVSPDPGINARAVAAWLGVVCWASIGVRLASRPGPPRLLHLVLSTLLSAWIVAVAIHLLWYYRPFA